MVELGDEVKDSVTGFKGVVISRTTYETSCNRMAVQPKVGKDGILPDEKYFDEPQLIVTKAKKKKEVVVKKKTEKPGGPHPAPVKSTTPKQR